MTISLRFATLLPVTGSIVLGQQGAVIRTETRVVLVDTIVTDKQGGYVRGLEAKDFRLWEDNREQKIQSVSVEKSGARPHSFVVFFAPMEAAERAIARQAVSGFIDANVGENRRIAVVSYNGGLKIGQNFTDDAGKLKTAVNAAMGTVGTTSNNNAAAFETIRALGGLARSLGAAEGRKTIVFVTSGIAQSSSQRTEMTAAIEACNKSDVAVYPVDVRPLAVDGVRDQFNAPFDDVDNNHVIERMARAGTPTRKLDSDTVVPDAGVSNQQALFRLASGTGGFVIPNASELARGLQKVGEEQSEYYVLSYTPAESMPDSKAGSCHTLRVKVDRGGTSVRARSNYCESKPQDLLAGTIAGRDLERRAASGQAGNIGAAMRLAYFYLSSEVARVNLTMEIPADALRFQTQKGKPGELKLLGIAANADGDVGARFSDAVKPDNENQGKALHYEKEFRLAPGKYTFTMAFSAGEESFGKLETPLTVEPRKAEELAMSGLVLSRETHPAADAGLDALGLTENTTPLVANGVQVVPAGSDRFRKSEAGFVYFEVYAREAAAVRVEMRVLDRTTQEDRVPRGSLRLGAARSGDAIPAGAKLPIEALAAGMYTLEITATDAAGKPVRRTADFEVY